MQRAGIKLPYQRYVSVSEVSYAAALNELRGECGFPQVCVEAALFKSQERVTTGDGTVTFKAFLQKTMVESFDSAMVCHSLVIYSQTVLWQQNWTGLCVRVATSI